MAPPPSSWYGGSTPDEPTQVVGHHPLIHSQRRRPTLCLLPVGHQFPSFEPPKNVGIYTCWPLTPIMSRQCLLVPPDPFVSQPISSLQSSHRPAYAIMTLNLSTLIKLYRSLYNYAKTTRPHVNCVPLAHISCITQTKMSGKKRSYTYLDISMLR